MVRNRDGKTTEERDGETHEEKHEEAWTKYCSGEEPKLIPFKLLPTSQT